MIKLLIPKLPSSAALAPYNAVAIAIIFAVQALIWFAIGFFAGRI